MVRGLQRDREELLSNIKTALAQNRPEAADALFFAWVDAESKRIKKVKTKLFAESEEVKQDKMEVEQEEKAGDEDQAVSGSANPDPQKIQKIEGVRPLSYHYLLCSSGL